MTEWRPVVGWEPRYEVSDRGEIRNRRGVVLRQQMHRDGRLFVGLFDGRSRTIQVSRLVADAFLGPRPEGLEVDHVNTDYTDNRATNLEYVTRSVNLRRRTAKGIGCGVRHASHKLTEQIVRDVRAAYAEGMGYKRLARAFGITRGHARDIALGVTWKHVPA